MNCITIQHCIVRQWAGEKAVSRYNYCIVTETKGGLRLLDCVTTQGRDTASQAMTRRWGVRRGALGRALGRGRQGAGALGAGAGGRQARGAGRRAGAAGARGARGEQPGRWVHGLGTRAGQGCALGALGLVFNLVFPLGIFPESLNEHCSSQFFFFGKKIYFKFN